MDIELSDIGKQRAIEIMEKIVEIRDEHQACTAREVSRLLCTAHTIIFGRMQRLREMGLIAWTDLTGSLHLTAKGVAWLEEQQMQAIVDAGSERDEVRAEPPRPAKKAAAKKAAAKK